MNRLIFSEAKIISCITTPIAASTFLEGCVYFLNTWMLAKLGNDTLAAGALVTNLFSSLVMILWGVFSSSSMLYARYYGEGNRKGIARLLGTTNLLAVLLGGITSCILWNSNIILHWLGQPANTITIATYYAHGLALAEIPDLLSFSLYNFLQGISRAHATFWLSLIYVPLNIASNYILVFGKFGVPPMGAAGVGYGTFISYCLLIGIIAIYFLSNRKIRIYCSRPFAFVWKEAAELLRVGIPLGIIWSLSYVFLFLVAAIFGQTSTDALAAYQIVAQWIAAFFVITVSLATVLKMRIGFALGEKNSAKISHASCATLGINICYLLLLAPIMIFLSRYLIGFDLNLNDPATQLVAHYAEGFFKIAFIYLFFYSLNYLLANGLIGLNDIRYLLIVCFFSMIIFGVPLAYLIGHYYPTQPERLFAAMICAEALSAIILARRYYIKTVNIRCHDSN